jgi:hypothetical protein
MIGQRIGPYEVVAKLARGTSVTQVPSRVRGLGMLLSCSSPTDAISTHGRGARREAHEAQSVGLANEGDHDGRRRDHEGGDADAERCLDS